ncbi:MAG: hypothetical protein FWE20_00595 [Defluviitaleaceae bacterium]|nr:hypothetical protein [Defluviitaleaceae bacterium]
MRKEEFSLIVIGALIVSAISLSAWIAYSELTRPTSPVIAIENNTIAWDVTGIGDITAGRFIRSYEVRVVIGNETFTAIVDGPTELGVTIAKGLTTLDLDSVQQAIDNAEVTVRTVRNLNSGTGFSRWSNTVIWVRE